MLSREMVISSQMMVVIDNDADALPLCQVEKQLGMPHSRASSALDQFSQSMALTNGATLHNDFFCHGSH